MAEALDGELLALRERLRTDTPFWAENCAVILNEDRATVALRARPWQLTFDRALEAQHAAGQPMRAIILKARKLGFSTWVQAKFMQRLTQTPYQYALNIGHQRPASSQLFDMGMLMWEKLPGDAKLGELIYGEGSGRAAPFSVRPQMVGQGTTRQGVRWMALGSKANPTAASIYETMTAGSKGAGRAATPSMIHASEAAHYDDPAFLVGVLNALPKRPGSIAVIESTANGFNHFHDRWERAVAGAEDPDTGGLYVPLFFGWQDNPYNVLPFSNDLARERFERTIGDPNGGGDDEEPELIAQFGVTLEQLRWRRVTIAEECDGKIENFHQEHPSTPEEAFIGSGNPVFSSILVSRAISEAKDEPEPVVGVLRGGDFHERRTRSGSILIPQEAVWVPEALMRAEDMDLWGATRSYLRVWEHPVNERTQADIPAPERKPDGQYVVFVDVAQGGGTTTEERDFSAIQVVDHLTGMQVAAYHSRIPIHDLPLAALLICLYFNEAWLAIEVTGLGIGPTDAVSKDYRYRRMYRRRHRGDDTRTGRKEKLIGWATTPVTKPTMEQTMGQQLKDGSHGLRDLLTAKQFTTYVEDERGRHGAQQGTHDDLVMAYMGVKRIAAELRPHDPAEQREKSVRGRRVSDDLTGY